MTKNTKILQVIDLIKNAELILLIEFLENNCDFNLSPPDLLPYDTPLGLAVESRNIEMIKALVKTGAFPYGIFLQDALDIFLDTRNLEVFKTLLQANINVNYKLEEGDTILIKAASLGLLNLVKLLIEYDADVNQKNQRGETALHYAAYSGQKKVFDFLAPLTSCDLREQAEEYLSSSLIHKKRKDNKRVEDFISAAAIGDIETVEKIIQDNIDINAIGTTGSTALHIAAFWGRAEIVRILIEANANVNLGDEMSGETPLMVAAANTVYRHTSITEGGDGQAKVVQILIEAGADVNAKTDEGWTAIIGAANAGDIETVQNLLNAGANVNSEDDFGDTALIRAMDAGHNEIVKLLLDAGATEE